MRPPSVRFLGGVQEIGGNKILLEDGEDRLLFDFGPSFSSRYAEFYVDFLKPRTTSPVRDLLEFDLIPWVDGLYGREALAGLTERYRAPEVSAVFVSHAHYDHAGYLRYVDPEIPVHLGVGTHRILEAIATSGSTEYGEHPWREFRPGETIRIGRFEVLPFPVDHSVPHAFGFLIRTREGAVVYTGDFRQHGPRRARTHAFLAAAAAERPEALIIEGTRAGPDRRRHFTEAGVRSGVEGLLRATPGLALACCYPRDVDRIRTLHAAAVASGRDLVVPLRMAHLLGELAHDAELDVPVPGRDPHLKVYRRSKRSYYRWERPWLDAAIDAEELRRQGRSALLLLDLFQFGELIDLRPEPGTPFVRSMSEPFSEEDPNDEVLRHWLDHFGLRLHQFHASGHCSAEELFDAVGQVDARRTFPIHTEHAEAFVGRSAGVTLPERSVAYPLGGGRPVR